MVVSSVKNKVIPEEKFDLDALIDKGAKVKADAAYELAELKRQQEEKEAEEKKKAEARKAKDKEKWYHINLRVDHGILIKIDEFRKNRIVCTRNAWIHEAIQEKILREEERNLK